MQFLRGLRQEDCKFKPYLSYTVSSQPAQGISETPSQNKKGRSLVHTSEAQGLLSKQERPQALSPALQKREERKKMSVDIIKTKKYKQYVHISFYLQCEAEINLSKAASITE